MAIPLAEDHRPDTHRTVGYPPMAGVAPTRKGTPRQPGEIPPRPPLAEIPPCPPLLKGGEGGFGRTLEPLLYPT